MRSLQLKYISVDRKSHTLHKHKLAEKLSDTSFVVNRKSKMRLAINTLLNLAYQNSSDLNSGLIKGAKIDLAFFEDHFEKYDTTKAGSFFAYKIHQKTVGISIHWNTQQVITFSYRDDQKKLLEQTIAELNKNYNATLANILAERKRHIIHPRQEKPVTHKSQRQPV